MPVYKAPVSDTLFLLSDVFDFQRYSNLPRFSEAPIDVVEAVLSEGGKFAEEVLQPLNLSGDREGCRRLPDGSVVTPKGFKEAYKAFVEGGWVGISAAGGIWRTGPAAFPRRRLERIYDRGEPGLRNVPRPDQRRDGRAAGSRRRRAEVPLPAENVDGRMDGHDEPHGAALRHRPRPHQDARRPAGRRFLRDIGPEDIHFVGRARPRRQHHPSRAGADRRRAGRRERDFALPRAEDSGERRRLAREPQRRRLRLDRAQDGHPRQFDLRDEFRRRQGLARRRGKPWAPRDVRNDERRPARRRGAGPRAIRSRLSERRGLREGAAAGPFALRRQGARKSPPIPSSCIPTYAGCCWKSGRSTKRRAR